MWCVVSRRAAATSTSSTRDLSRPTPGVARSRRRPPTTPDIRRPCRRPPATQDRYTPDTTHQRQPATQLQLDTVTWSTSRELCRLLASLPPSPSAPDHPRAMFSRLVHLIGVDFSFLFFLGQRTNSIPSLLSPPSLLFRSRP